jgi:hypothetical protein
MPPAVPGWTVETQRATTELDPATGRAVKGTAVGFVTAKGLHGEIFIPQAVYMLGPDRVKPLIAAAVSNMDSIHGLSG